MKKTEWMLVAGAMCVAVVSCFLAGCETAEGTSGLNVNPAYVDFRGISDNAVVLQVGGATNVDSGLRTLSLPLEWTVATPSLGSISAASGTQATYVRSTAHGANVVTVRDQYGAEGHVTIQQ